MVNQTSAPNGGDARSSLSREDAMRTNHVVSVTLAFLMIAWAGSSNAQEPTTYVTPVGVPLAAPVYFVNFLISYFTNPEGAAFMPAYRAALPQEVYTCLVEHPEGC